MEVGDWICFKKNTRRLWLWKENGIVSPQNFSKLMHVHHVRVLFQAGVPRLPLETEKQSPKVCSLTMGHRAESSSAKPRVVFFPLLFEIIFKLLK